MNVWWAAPALADREAIYTFIEADNPAAAVALDLALVRAAERLATHPGAGRPGRIAGTREWVVHPHFLLVYECLEDAVMVLGVVHTARQWPALGE